MNHTIGAKWLRPGGHIPAAKSGEGEDHITGKIVTANHGNADKAGDIEGMIIDGSNVDKEINRGGNQGFSFNANKEAKIQNIIIQSNNNKLDKLNVETDGPEIAIVDPKRRRMSEAHELSTGDVPGSHEDSTVATEDVSKNLVVAGAVQQPRLAL